MNELYHYGILGQKWGVRRYQNEDGSYTSEGRRRYGRGEKMEPSSNDSSVTKRVKRDYNNLTDSEFRSKYKASKDRYRKKVNRYGDPYMNAPMAKIGKKLEKNKNSYLMRKGSDLANSYTARRDKKVNTIKLEKMKQAELNKLLNEMSKVDYNDPEFSESVKLGKKRLKEIQKYDF